MKLKWILPIIGLAIGIALIGLGTLIISENFRANLMEYHDDWGDSTDEGYILMQPNKDAMRVGVLMTVSGTIITSLALVGIAGFWKEKKRG